MISIFTHSACMILHLLLFSLNVEGYVSISVGSLSVYLSISNFTKKHERIFMNLSGFVVPGTRKNGKHFRIFYLTPWTHDSLATLQENG